MTQTETELARIAQECGFVLVKHPRQPFYLRDFEGSTIGPFKSRELSMWLAGFSRGMHTHAPGCQCGRAACNFRNVKMATEGGA